MIKVGVMKILEVEKQLGNMKYKAPMVIARALNRAAANAKSSASKKVRETYNVKSKDISSTIKILKANKNRLGAVVKSTGTKVSLIKFKVTPKKRLKKQKKVKVAVKKDGMKELNHAFIADINGPKVFERVGKNRLPIKHLFGPSVPEMLGGKSVREFVEIESEKTFEKRLEHEINRELGRNS